MVHPLSAARTRGALGTSYWGATYSSGFRLGRAFPAPAPGGLHRGSSLGALGPDTMLHLSPTLGTVSHLLLRPIIPSRLDHHILLRALSRLDLSTWADLTIRAPDGTRTWLDLPLLLPVLSLPSFPPVPQPWLDDPQRLAQGDSADSSAVRVIGPGAVSNNSSASPRLVSTTPSNVGSLSPPATVDPAPSLAPETPSSSPPPTSSPDVRTASWFSGNVVNIRVLSGRTSPTRPV